MNALVVFAHLDDETMMCGGTLALLAKEGWMVYYLCATHGQGGECGHPFQRVESSRTSSCKRWKNFARNKNIGAA